MPLQQLADAWHTLFFEPESSAPVALFRVAFGLVQIANAFLLLPVLKRYYGPQAFLPLKVVREADGRRRFSLFWLLPDNNRTLYLMWTLLLAASVMVCVGLATRAATVVLFVLLLSFHHRNPCVINSGDTLLRLLTFLLIFAPAADYLSVDALLWARQDEPPVAAPWALRLMQAQVAIVYLRTVFWKLRGERWRDGTAAAYPLRLRSYQRLAAPGWWLSPRPLSRWLVAAATWGTLVVEAAMGTLVWIREFRYPVLIAVAAMHLGLELVINVGLFGWLMIATMLLFLFPQDAAWLVRLFS